MKRAKIFMSAVVASSIIFGSNLHLFAEDGKNIDAVPKLISQQENNNTQENEKNKALNIKFKEYSDQYGRFFGSYPDIEKMGDLSRQIYHDIDTTISDLNINANEDIVDAIIKSKVDQDDNFTKIYVSVEFEENKTDFVYYVDKETMREFSQAEYEKKQKEIDEKKAEDKKNEDESREITMVPLRANAESFGWNVEWRKKEDNVPARAILTKGQAKIAVLYNSTLSYDLAITKDVTVNNIITEKLERSTELIDDSILYVPSSFIEKYLNTEKTKASTENSADAKKENVSSSDNKNK